MKGLAGKSVWLLTLVAIALATLMVAVAMPVRSAPGDGGSLHAVSVDPPTKNAPINAADIQWGPGPDFLPPGVQMVILDGNPAEAKQITLRLKIPAGYEFPAHWHPTQENVTVLSGTFYAGMGDKLDYAWSAPPSAAADALSLLLGPQRARLLKCLTIPSTTSAPAQLFKVTPAAISQQLNWLRQVGMVTA